MKIVTVVGARPNFMKVAPIIRAIDKHNEGAHEANAGEGIVGPIHHVLVHTGQHHDALMSDAFFADLNLPRPDIQLGVGAGSHAVQTAEILKRFAEVLLRERPDVVIVVGDVNSTVACAMATAKISFDSLGGRPLLAHVEAGLRSFDKTMPEELNRIITDHLSDMLFVTEESGLRNLHKEGISRDAVHFVGNTMIDSVLAFEGKAEESRILGQLRLREEGSRRGIAEFALLTLHRPSNVDNREAFQRILGGLEELAASFPVIFPVHPRTRQKIAEFGLELSGDPSARSSRSTGNGFVLTEPLSYLDCLCLMKHARIVVTDSGGIQEETTCLGVPCVTVRDNTERPSTIETGTNVLAGTAKEKIACAIRQQLAGNGRGSRPEKWDGHAAQRILERLLHAYIARRGDGVFDTEVVAAKANCHGC